MHILARAALTASLLTALLCPYGSEAAPKPRYESPIRAELEKDMAPRQLMPHYSEELAYGSIEAEWPRLGLAEADAAAQEFVESSIIDFKGRALQCTAEMAAMGLKLPSCELEIKAAVSGNGKTVGLLWLIYEYMGGAHGSVALESRTYSYEDSRLLGLEDLFEAPEEALRIASIVTRDQLREKRLPADMYLPGTEPDAYNFRVFALTESGISFYFEPYQVGPWAAGSVQTYVPLDVFEDARPRREYWPEK
jgi:hypothetical protein